MQPKENLLHDQVREVLFEGPLMLVEKEKTTDAYVFLFSDLLLFTKIMSKNSKKGRSVSTILQPSILLLVNVTYKR